MSREVVRDRVRKLIQAELIRELAALPPEFLLTRKQATLLGNLSRSYLEERMAAGDGPPYIKRGRYVRYPKGEFLAWLAQYRRAPVGRR
jgi:predicted DNA-binding transcriptional regulator AlpA